jgi:chemotaxis protein CheD
VLNEDLGDVFARRVVYFPQTGRLRVKKLTAGRDDTLVARERQYLRQLDRNIPEGEIELF